MKDFCIVAGTITSNILMDDLVTRLINGGMQANENNRQYLRINERASIELRHGFDHEYQVVGDAELLDDLIEVTERFCGIMKRHDLQHSLELYNVEGDIAGEYIHP